MKINDLEIQLLKLTKADWCMLERYGLVDNSEGFSNGFSDTTKMASSVGLGETPSLFILPGKYAYLAHYQSGCFYPVWHKLILKSDDVVIEYRGRTYRPILNFVKKIKGENVIEKVYQHLRK